MIDTETIASCAEHDEPMPTDNFDSSLLSIWESIYEMPAELNRPLYSDSGWIYQFSILLAKHFGYCAGAVSYFRHWTRARDTVIALTNFGRETSQALDRPQWEELRRVFAQGRFGESRRQPGVRQGLAFPRKSEFERRQGCVLMPDGELSYFSLFYLWQQAQPEYAEKPRAALIDFLKEWMVVLGVLSDTQSPTVRLIRMLLWMQEYSGIDQSTKRAVQQFTTELLNIFETHNRILELNDSANSVALLSHSISSLSWESLTDLIDLLIEILDSDLKKGEEVGVEMAGLIALRCVKSPDKLYGLQSIDGIREYVSSLGTAFLDRDCTDRSNVIIPISVSRLNEDLYPIYYFGSHLGISPQIYEISQGVSAATGKYHRFRLCLSSLCGMLLAGEIVKIESDLQEQRLEKEIADAVAHDLARSVYEGLAAGDFTITSDETFPDDHPDVQRLLISADVQQQTLLGIFAAPWLQRERQKGWVKVEWSNRYPDTADAEFWRDAIAYHSAIVLYSMVNPVINQLRRGRRFPEEVQKAEEVLKQVCISYLFTSESMPSIQSERKIYHDSHLLYEIMRGFEARRQQLIPWPLSVSNLGEVIVYEGQKSIVLAPIKEALRNAVKYIVDCVCGERLDMGEDGWINNGAFSIGLLVQLDAEARTFRFRIDNAIHPLRGTIDQLPPSLTKIQKLMENYWTIELRNSDSRVVIDASFTCCPLAEGA